MQPAEPSSPYVLGLDIGVASIGWVRMAITPEGTPASLLQAGVHTFAAGIEGDFERGRENSPGLARRSARLTRRLIDRRHRRRKMVLRLLQRAGLLPPGLTGSPQQVHDYLLAVDAHLRARQLQNPNRTAANVFYYRLRANAVDPNSAVSADELGRALYHLAQRRGFLSNRKAAKRDEDEGAVRQGILELQEAMGTRTLGQYFAGLDPEEQRIRGRWTARAMYVDEFNRICDAQSPHYPILRGEFRTELFHAIFHQRPLKSARHLIGRCELVPGARRAAMGDRLFQRFRILQSVNHITVVAPDGSPRPLSNDERAKLVAALHECGDLTNARIRGKSVLGLPKGTTLNLGSDDEKSVPGNRTDQRMREVFGAKWDELGESKRDEIVLEVLGFQNGEALARRAKKAWGLTDEEAQALAHIRLEQGYAAHSRKALRRLVERMQDGTPYGTARRALFPECFRPVKPVDRLPPVLRSVPALRNPAVTRTLTELRKLVNEIVRVHGKPDRIRIELARDLKRGRKERERVSKEIDAQTRVSARAKERILREAGIAAPRRSDVEKALLFEECGGRCPYTGRSIDFRSLFGPNPQFDVEHILPFSRSLDNSFVNKTLCYHEENRERKGNRTPYEAYERSPDIYDAIKTRVRQFQGRGAREKLRRFEMTCIPEDFISRQLADTRYASRLAGDYLALLYGGRVDADGTLRVQVSTGGLTKHIRDELRLNALFDDFAQSLGAGGGPQGARRLDELKRISHRHHALDALAVALASPDLVRRLQSAAARAGESGRRLFAPIEEPWPHFLEDARRMFLSMNISRRLTRKVAGELHKATNYSKEQKAPNRKGKPVACRHIRVPLVRLKPNQVENIVDPIVREKVRTWLAQPPSDASGGAIELPWLQTHDGRKVPIKSVRLRESVNAVQLRAGDGSRYVRLGANHHSVIVAVLNESGEEVRWENHPLTLLDAYKRKSANPRLPVVQTDWGDGRRFKFSLCADEYVMVTGPQGDQLCRLLSLSEKELEFRLHDDARPATEARKPGNTIRLRFPAEKLRRHHARKVRVTYLGEVIPARD